jgi:hypothetical protein
MPEAPDAAAPDGAPSTPAPAPAESAAPAPPSLGSLRDAFRADPDGAALKVGPRRGPDETPHDDAATPEESAPGDATAPPDASKPGAQGALSRRGAAAAISERDAEIERLVAERRQADAQLEAHRQQLSRVQAQQEAAAKAATDLIGDDREFNRLQDARLRNRTLSYEEDEKLDRMIQWREYAQTFWELADRGHKTLVARALGERVKQHGLDQQVAFGADVPALVDHAVAVTEARVRAEQAERIKELEAEVTGLRTRAAANGRAAPLVGGASAGSGAVGRMPDDGAPAQEWFRYAIRERQSAGPGNGARQTRR